VAVKVADVDTPLHIAAGFDDKLVGAEGAVRTIAITALRDDDTQPGVLYRASA
jgi:hypothetical protein